MSSIELCGAPTSNGKTCNMPKGHHAQFHRYRDYKSPIEWRILTKSKKVVDAGNGRERLGYAITTSLKKFDSIVIEIEA